MNRQPPAIGTVEGGYRFKGGDPAQESSWEQVAPIDVSDAYGAGARQLPNGRIERVGPRGGIEKIGSAGGGASEASNLVGADARSRYMLGLQPMTDAQLALSELEATGNPINRNWGAHLVDNVTDNRLFKNVGDAAARWLGGEDYQKYQQAASTYEAALLPIMSGAAVTDSEAARQIRADLPAWGDSDEVIARKSQNRANRINAVAEGIGREAPFTGNNSDEQPISIAGMSAADLLKLTPGTAIQLEDGTVTRLTGAPRIGGDGRQVSPGVFVSEETPEGAVAQREQSPDWWRRLDGMVRGAADTMTFGYADELAAGGDAAIGRGQGDTFRERYDNNLHVQRALDRADQQAIPIARMTGQIGGAVAAPGAAASGRFLAGAPTIAQSVGRGAVTGGVFGAAYGSGATEGNRVQGAIDGGIAGAATGGAMAGGLQGAGRAARGLFGRQPSRSPDVKTLIENGVFVTPGAQRGGLPQSLENLSQRAPIMGPAVAQARSRSIDSVNRAVGNRSLSHIGEGVPAGIEVGADMVDYVARRLGSQFDRAADMVPEVAPDDMFYRNVATIAQGISDLPEGVGRQFMNIVQDRLTRLQGPVTGRQLRQVESEIGGLASTVEDQQLSRMLSGVQEELQELMGRANPEAGEVLRKARAGYRDFVTMRRASQAAGGSAFSPSQLMTAVRTTDDSVGKGATARGLSPLQDLAMAAKNVIPDSYGNPGTADVGGYIGLGMLAGANPLLAGATAASLAGGNSIYSRMGRQVVESLPVNPTPSQMQEAMSKLGELSQRDPRVSELLTALLNTSRAATIPALAGGAATQ